MSNEAKNLKTLGIRVAPEYYDNVRHHAESRNLSISDVIREALNGLMEADSKKATIDKTALKEVSTTFQSALETMEKQLEQKDQQIDQLHQLMAMKEKSVTEAMTQLSRATQRIEFLRKPRTMWQRIKAGFASEAG